MENVEKKTVNEKKVLDSYLYCKEAKIKGRRAGRVSQVIKKALTEWKTPRDYMGEEYPDYYVGPGRSRDSDSYENSNFDVALEMLGGEDGENVMVVRASHFAAGWVETILVKKSATDKVKILEEIEEKLKDYPILSDDDVSQKQVDIAEQIAEDASGWEDLIVEDIVNGDFLENLTD